MGCWLEEGHGKKLEILRDFAEHIFAAFLMKIVEYFKNMSKEIQNLKEIKNNKF